MNAWSMDGIMSWLIDAKRYGEDLDLDDWDDWWSDGHIHYTIYNQLYHKLKKTHHQSESIVWTIC